MALGSVREENATIGGSMVQHGRTGVEAMNAIAAVSLAAALALAAGGCSRGEPKAAVDPVSRRVTPSGAVVGFVGEYGSHVWRGIPYAKPPVGDLRWRAPEAPAPWSGTREAFAFGSACTQYGSPFGGVDGAEPGEPAGGEDCLYLNVYAPRRSEAEAAGVRLPVMLWIHGGGNTIGEAGFYNGGNLAATHDVVVVTINYRLGPFGWLRHAALRGEGASELDRSGNYATLDMIRALEWVRDHVSAFGGDPGNVTIFGESAGGTNVYSLLLSPRARGLFHRAIVQSGSLRMSEVSEAEGFVEDGAGGANTSGEMILRLLAADGAENRAAAKRRLAGMTPAEVESYLRGKTGYEILAASEPERSGMIDMPRVFRDGLVLPAGDPLETLFAGQYNQVPVMIGTTRDENKLFLFADPARVRRVLWIFPRLRDEDGYNLSAEYLAKMWKATGADGPAAAMREVQGPSVFVYRFDWDEEPALLGADLSVMLGAAHAFEIPFVFGHFDLGSEGNVIFTDDNEPGRKALSAQMMSYWAEFAYAGAPGRGRSGDLPQWTAWDSSSAQAPKFAVLDTAAGGGVRMSADALTVEGILAAVDDDPRLATQRDKCAIFRELADWSRGFDKKQYAAAGRNGCADYPFDSYPWKG
jgi:para-nitrobenzyl esterase